MIVVTGGAGFIGSNLVQALNAQGENDILVVDNLKCGQKYSNLLNCDIADYCDQDEFLQQIFHQSRRLDHVKAIFHQGACSSTTEWDGRYLLNNNYNYSKTLLYFSLKKQVPLIYASSAAVYGKSTVFGEQLESNEKPLNLYGYSKLLFDRYIRKLSFQLKSQVVGLRYFNVYGPHEAHKETMASVVFHFNRQLKEQGVIKLFQGTDEVCDGEQLRDFVFVKDIVDTNLWFYTHPEVSGVFNVGTGQSRTFNDLAKAVIAWHGRGQIEYIPFPEHLRGHYQNFTQADITHLRNVGCDVKFHSLEQGIPRYLDWLNGK